MKKNIIIAVLSLLLMISLGYIAVEQEVFSRTHNNLTFQDVYNLKEPSVLYFYSDDCKYCVGFSPAFEKTSKMYKDEYHFLKLNVYDANNTQLCHKLKIRSIPAVFIFEPRNKMVHPIHPYYYNEQGLKSVLDKYMKKRFSKQKDEQKV